MVFVTAGMGGGTGTGAAPVIAKTARDMGILTVGVVTKPFHFEGQRRMRTAESGIAELHKVVDTLLIIPNQNLFRVANEKTTFADAFAMADQVLYSGVACITDLMVKEGLINLDFADVRAVMREMGKAMMGTGEASGDKRALTAAEAAIANPLIDDSSMKGARGLLISITGGKDLTLFEVDEAATRIREEVDQDANIIVGATFDESLDGVIRVSVVATGIEQALISRNAARRRPRPLANAGGADRHAGKPPRRSDRAAARRQRSGWPNAPHKLEAPAAGAGGRRRAAPRAAEQRRTRGARRDRRRGRPGSPAAGRRRCSRPPMATSRFARSRRSRRCSRIMTSRAPRLSEPATPGDLHPAGGRAAAGPRAPDAEVRGPADAGAGRNPAGPRRSRGGASAEDPDVAAAAPGQCRPRPPRRRDRAADRGPRLGSGDAADAAAAGAQAAAHRSPSRSRPTSRYRSMPGGRRRKVWTPMAARHLLRRRHRATTI